MAKANGGTLPEMAKDLADQAIHSDWLVNVGLALLVTIAGLWLAKVMARALDRVMGRFEVEKILRDFLRNVAYAVALVVVAVAALDSVGVPVTSLLAVLGAAGLAVGLALKDSLSNIASGVMLIVLRPFRAGDAVLIAGQEGIVEQVRIFQTQLRTYQNHSVVLPNSQITTQPIVNFTAREQRRIDLPVGIGYGDDIGKARDVLLALAAENAKVLAEPASDVVVTDLGDSSVNLMLRAWVATPDFPSARSELTEAVHRGFGKAGISIPFPQRDLHVYHHDSEGRAVDPARASLVDAADPD